MDNSQDTNVNNLPAVCLKDPVNTSLENTRFDTMDPIDNIIDNAFNVDTSTNKNSPVNSCDIEIVHLSRRSKRL